MDEVFCVMECADGDPDDIMATLVAIFSDIVLAAEFVEEVMEMGEGVLLRVERWDVDGATSEMVTGKDQDVLVVQSPDKKSS